MTAVVGADCVAGPPLSWFGPIRELPACTYEKSCGGGLPRLELGVGIGGLFDVNGDGRPESFASPGGSFVSKGEPVPCECWLAVEETFVEDGEVIIERRCIAERQPLAEIALALGWEYAFVEDGTWGWKDLDGDGDADLVIPIRGYSSQWGEVGRAYWLENTGFEATQPLTGDLNSDGAVNSADLALLLGGWTGS